MTKDHSTDAGGFSAKEIKMVVKFIDNLGDGENAGDGTIDNGELEHAFRQGRRTRANAAMEGVGANLCKRFRKMLKTATDKETGLTGIGLKKWFKSCDTSGAGKGDGQISTKELREGLVKIGSEEMKFSEDDLINFIRYMDPEADGDMGIAEFEEGLKRSEQPPSALAFAQKAGRIMGRLEDFMIENSMRIKDLFKFIDTDRSGHITLEELREGLMKMNTDVAAKFAAKKEGLVAARKAKEAEKVKKFQDDLNGRLAILEQTGAIKVLAGLDKFMHDTGQRIVDLFGKSGFDKSGDGCLGRNEFYKAMKQIGIDCTKKECRALIDVIDDSGDGEIEAYEMEKIVRRYRIDMIYKRDERKAAKKDEAKRRLLGRSGPEIDDSENDFVRMMKEKANAKHGLISSLKKITHDEEEKAEQAMHGTKKKKVSNAHSSWKTLPEIAVGKIPKLKKSRRVTSGSVLDSSWLTSFDRNMKSHIKKLDRKTGVD
jgi:Ca2+-binding EF-hand superfamily protein